MCSGHREGLSTDGWAKLGKMRLAWSRGPEAREGSNQEITVVRPVCYRVGPLRGRTELDRVGPRAVRRLGCQSWQEVVRPDPGEQLGARAGAAEGRAGLLGLKGRAGRLDVGRRKMCVQSLGVLSQGCGGQEGAHRTSPLPSTPWPLCLLARNTLQREHVCRYL